MLASRHFLAAGGSGTMAANGSFQCEVEKLADDAQGNKVTMVKCHGRLVTEYAGNVKETVAPLIPLGGRIVVDLSDVNYLSRWAPRGPQRPKSGVGAGSLRI